MTGALALAQPADADEQRSRDDLIAQLRTLRDDRIALLEVEARRITALTDPTPESLLRRLSGDPQFEVDDAFGLQRDPLARSLWAYLRATGLFDATERAMQVRVHRGNDRVYEAWSIDAPIQLDADAVDDQALAEEIAARLHHEDGCRVEAVDLPPEEGESQEVLVAVTFFGDYSSQRTVRPDKKTEILYFRPPDELLLVYSPRRRRIEICSRNPGDRRLVANIFAEETLHHDVSNKPLTQKTYDLSRFRRSLKLTIPEDEAHRVRRATITEVQVALGEWSRKVTLAVAPEDDIDRVAREVFGAIIPRSGGGFVTRVRFHIEHVNDQGRKATLKFDVFGRNKSNIQSERHPAKRSLGYRLLEAWGVLERVGDFTATEKREKLPQLLALYDLPEREVSAPVLDELGIDPDEFVHAGFLARRGWSEVVLFEDDEVGEIMHDVNRERPDGQATLSLTEGGEGPQVPGQDLARYEIRVDYLRDALREVVGVLDLEGRVRHLDDHLHHLGTVEIGLASAPVYLARGLSDPRVLERVDRLVRSESNRIRGIVFVPQDVGFPYHGAHVVLSLRDNVDPETGQLDTAAVRVAYEASVDPAARGSAVHFRKQGEKAAQIVVPGQEPRIVTGAKKVLLFERLYMAYRGREIGVKLEVLIAYAGFSQLPQLFGPEWAEFNDRYLYSPRYSYWALCDEPISL